MYQPFALSNTSTCLGILSISPFNIPALTAHHTSNKWRFNILLITVGEPKRYFVSGYHRWSSSLTYAQRFSIGFISSEFSSQSIIINPYSFVTSFSQSQVKLVVWELVLSCWNTISYRPSAPITSMYSKRYWSKIMMYCSFLIEPSINTIGPSLSLIKHLHIIYDNLSSRAFVTIFFDIYFSALFWCHYTHTVYVSLSFWIVNSSDHITLVHSFTVQCRYALAYSKHFLACHLFNKGLFNTLHF